MSSVEKEAAIASLEWAQRVFAEVAAADDAEEQAASNLAEHMLDAEIAVVGGLDADAENKAHEAARAYVQDIALTHGRKRLTALRQRNRMLGAAMARAVA
jgi:hypothetical protein